MQKFKGYDFPSNLHLFTILGQHFALDVNSGAVHRLDQAAFFFMREMVNNGGDWEQAMQACQARYGAEAATGAADELGRAADESSLFTPPEDLDWFAYGPAVPKAICLNVAHACNMRCRYCFAGQGSFGGQRALMNRETARRTIDFLVERSHGRRYLELDFFGGEPLLNPGVVRETVEYGREKAASAGKEITFTLTTNALELDEKTRAFLKENNVQVILSLDGRPETNDHMRLLPDGGGTYDRVAKNIMAAVAMEPASYYVRGTFTAHNLDFTQDFRHLAGLGLDNISLEPAVNVAEELALTEEHLPRLLEEYEKLTLALDEYRRQGREINFFHFNLDVNRGPCLAKRLTGCGAGVEYLAVTPEGDIYPCHQFVGRPEFLMGNVDSGVVDPNLVERFSRNTVVNKECKRCWARFYCGGGCHANAFFANGRMEQPHRLSCELHRKRVECSFYLAWARCEDNA